MAAPLSNARDQAYAEGAEFGRELSNQAGSCPYDHVEIELRLAWMDGFGMHRPYNIEQGAPPAGAAWTWTRGGV